MATALSSSYQCTSLGLRQIVPPLPTSASHPAAFNLRLVAPLSEKSCFLTLGGLLAVTTLTTFLGIWKDSLVSPVTYNTRSIQVNRKRCMSYMYYFLQIFAKFLLISFVKGRVFEEDPEQAIHE